MERILQCERDLIVPYPEIEISENTHIYNGHALIEAKVATMRDENTPCSVFRSLVQEVTMLMCFDAMSHLKLEEWYVRTPICETVGKRIAGKKLVLVPIWRAGDAMLPAMQAIVPQARTGSVGVYRDEETLRPHKYFWKMPKDIENREAFVLDPMLATGGSADFVVRELKRIGCPAVHFMCIIAAPQGVNLMQKNHPDVELYIAHLDRGLNAHGYIVPGLGDAGDRIYGTK